MLKYNKKMYMDKNVAKHPRRYKRYLKKQKPLKIFYCIVMPANDENCMDIYSNGQFWLKYMHETSDMEVIGLAHSRSSALKLVENMMMDIYRKNQDISAEAVHDFFR